MRSSNKIAAMALALAIGSTMSVATAFAEGEETPAAPAVSEEVIPAETDDESSEVTEVTPDTEETPSNVEKFGDVTVTIENGGSKITFYDTSSNMSMIFVNGVATVDGTVITNGSSITSADNSDRLFEIIEMVDNMNITTMVFTDNVTEVRGDCGTVLGITQVKFGKNISYIANDAFSGCTGLKSVHGYKGTAAETFADANNLEFVALDAPISVSTTTAAPAATTTANNATTTAANKKTTTTSKTTSTKKLSTTTAAKTTTTATTTSSTSPKTGDHGVGAVVSLLGAAAATLAVTRKKKHE